ncbi:nitroreductase family protein, partial [Thermodesulfobacteriota bacterium]
DIDLLKSVLEAGIWAPSSCNKQTLRLFATNNPDLAVECLKTCKGGTCFTDFIPCFISFCADLRSYVMPDEAWLAQVDTGMAAQNCCLTATSLKLSLTPLSWCQHDQFEDRKLRELLNIPEYCRIIVNGVMGYPSVITATPERKKIETFAKIYT